MSSLLELTEDDAQRRRAALATMLNMMDIPTSRKEPTQANLRWLTRNINVRNVDNPMVQPAKDLIKWLLRQPHA